MIDRLGGHDAVLAYWEIVEYLMKKVVPGDPFEIGPGSYYDISYLDILDLLAVVARTANDSMVYSVLRSIADTLSSRLGKGRFTRDQVSSIAQRMRELIAELLPSPTGIAHEGFQIASLALVYSLDPADAATWLSLVARARDIPNRADRALVFGMIAERVPKRGPVDRCELLRDALSVTRTMPSYLDRINRYDALAGFAHDIDPALERSILEEGMRFAIARSHPSGPSAQRRMIDAAYRIDPEFAACLANLTDTDAVRREAKLAARRRLEEQDLRRQLAAAERSPVAPPDDNTKLSGALHNYDDV